MANPVGHPRQYDREAIIAMICLRLETGEPLSLICDTPGIPGVTTLHVWGQENEEISERIARARARGVDKLMFDVIDIIDDREADPDPQSRKVRAWGRMELAKRFDPKRYGDQKADMNVNVGVGVNVAVMSEDRRKALMDKKRAAIERRRAKELPEKGE